MSKPNQLILVGGGSTIKEGIEKGLWDKLKDRYTIALNYSYKHLNSTFLTYVDAKFYEGRETHAEVANLPLIVGKRHMADRGIHPNTILLPSMPFWNRELNPGIYSAILCGIWALSLGIYLLDEGEIFLLGYDFGEVRTEKQEEQLGHIGEIIRISQKDKEGQPLTHYYQGEVKHNGVGRVNWYNGKDRAERAFSPFKNEVKCKIYNVSLISKIKTFPKISYDDFLGRLDNVIVNQDELRTEIRNKLTNRSWGVT